MQSATPEQPPSPARRTASSAQRSWQRPPIEACGGSDAVLLGNHGLVACGRDLKSAYGLACNLEYVAELQYRTMCIGTPNILTDEQMAEVMERFRSYGQPGSGKAGY